ERQAHEHQRKRELRGRRRLARAELHPQPGEDGRKEDHERAWMATNHDANRKNTNTAAMRFHSSRVKLRSHCHSRITRPRSLGPIACCGDGGSAAGRSGPASRAIAGWRCLRPTTYWTSPSVIPTPAHANPRCQSIPSAILPATIGPTTAPTLMPMKKIENPASRRPSPGSYSDPTSVDALGFNNPVPMTMSQRPAWKNGNGWK